MASSPACSLVTGGTSTAYTVTTNQNNSGGAHGICGAGTVPNNPDDRGDAEQHQRPLRKLAWECVASFRYRQRTYHGTCLICRGHFFFDLPSPSFCNRTWPSAVLVDELNAGGLMRIPNLIRYAGSKPRASATSRGDRSPVVPTRRLRLRSYGCRGDGLCTEVR
jgi:hypothetical protein